MKRLNSIFQYDIFTAAAAIFVTAAMLILTVLSNGNGLFYLVSILTGLFIMLRFSYGRIWTGVVFLAAPFVTVWALENYTHVITDLTPAILFLNVLFFYLLYTACLFLTGSMRVGMILGTAVPMIFGLANYFVVQFRGNPIVPWDFLSFGTAMSVADNYEFTFTPKIVISLMTFVWIILIASKSNVRFRRWKLRLGAGIVSVMLLIAYICGIQNAEVQTFFGMDKTLFTLNVMYRNNGIAAGFLGNLQYLNIKEPNGYSVKRVEEIMQAAETEATAGNGGVLPHLIVIMDEAFSDLSVWGDYTTNQEVMPFFRQLQETGIGGELYVSVKGGNTANSEYEFLTGDTMAFLPAGCVPYQQYLNSDMPGLTSHLKGLGYHNVAIHPYNRSGWDRDVVYEYFGFDEFLDKEAFDQPYRMRGYISDSSAFEKIIEQYELRQEGEPLFVFEVTMQNHGGYSKENPDFLTYVKLEGIENKTLSIESMEKYLTLMNETDKALQDLVNYFEQQEEPVVVLMFGDHQPSDYITNAAQRVCKTVPGNSLEEQQTGYRVPFAIWSNQQIEQKYYDGISLNYLGGILLEAAGVPLTGYQNYLQELMQTLPVTSGLVIRDAEGVFYSYEEHPYQDMLNEYQILQYNHLVDDTHRIGTFFE